MGTRLAASCLLLAAPAITFAAEPPYDFKGLVLGATLAAVQKLGKYECRAWNKPEADVLCELKVGATESIAGAQAMKVNLNFYDDRLARIVVWYPFTAYIEVFPALATKYGSFKSTKRDYGSSGGVTEARWENQTSTLVHRALLAPNRSVGQVEYELKSAGEWQLLREDKARKLRAKDL